jgi:hypothetical protein
LSWQYQDVSLKLILQELLQSLAVKRHHDTVYLPREVVREPLHLKPPSIVGGYHFYFSAHNAGAEQFVDLLAEYSDSVMRENGQSLSTKLNNVVVQQAKKVNGAISNQRSTQSRFGWTGTILRSRVGQMTRARSRKPPSTTSTASGLSHVVKLTKTCDQQRMAHASHFLCYLNSRTHSSGEATAAFHAELEYALRHGIHILLVHEMRPEADGATFKDIIDDTPEGLKWDSVAHAKRLYKELAVMICGSSSGGSAHLNVGLHLLINAMACAPAAAPPVLTASTIAAEIEEIRSEMEQLISPPQAADGLPTESCGEPSPAGAAATRVTEATKCVAEAPPVEMMQAALLHARPLVPLAQLPVSSEGGDYLPLVKASGALGADEEGGIGGLIEKIGKSLSGMLTPGTDRSLPLPSQRAAPSNRPILTPITEAHSLEA